MASKEKKKTGKKDAKKEGKKEKKKHEKKPASHAPHKGKTPAPSSGAPSAGSGSGGVPIAMPPSKELNQKFEALLSQLGIGEAQKEGMRSMSNRDKWLLICQNTKTTNDDEETPTRHIETLKKGSITTKKMEELRVLLAGRPVAWIQEFLKLDGLPLIFHVLDEKFKAYKGDEDTEIINECARCLKALMNSQPGLEAVIMSDDSITYLGQTLDFVTGRMKVVIVEVLSALCLLSPEAHAQTVEIMKAKSLHQGAKSTSRFGDLVQRMDADNVDLKVTVMQLINAMLSGGDEATQEDIKKLFDIANVVDKLRKGQMKAALEVQLDVYDQMASEHLSTDAPEPAIINKDDALALFNALAEKVASTAVNDVLASILQHLMLVRGEGKSGKIAWQTIDKFIQMAAAAPQPKDDAEFGRVVCKDLLSLLDGRLDITEAASEGSKAANSVKEILESKTLSAEEKADKVSRLLSSVTEQLDDVKAKLAKTQERLLEVESKGGSVSSEGGVVPPAPGPDGGGVIPPPPPGPDGGGVIPPPPPGPDGGIPPPPPGPGGIPPPPPGPGGVPPPPGWSVAAPSRPKKASAKPAVPLKQFNWAKIADAKTLNTVWEKLSDDHVKVNQKELEQFFAAAAPKKEAPAEGDAAAPPAGDKGQPKSAKKNVSMLDPRRGQNVSIMLARFKMPPSDIRKAIETLNESVLTADNLAALKQYIPTDEELAAIMEVDDKDSLNIADKYFLEVAKIPDLAPRLECLHARATFGAKAGSVSASIDALSNGCLEVKNSKSFAKYLEVVLKIGNVLNGGSFRGGAYGFKLDSLVKIADVRSSNKETPTLLHYIAAKAETDYPELMKLHSEFVELPAAAKESLSQISTDLAALEKNLHLVEAQIKKAEGGGMKQEHDDEEKEKEKNPSPRAVPQRQLSPNDPFIIAMKQFYERASKACTSMANRLKSLETLYKELLAFYGEEPATPVEAFLGTVCRAVSLFDKAVDDNQKRRVAAAKAVEAEARREALKKKTAASKPAVDVPGGPSDRNVMDNLIGQLHTGDAFVGRTALRSAQARAGPPQKDAGEKGQMANEALAIFAKMKVKRETVTS